MSLVNYTADIDDTGMWAKIPTISSLVAIVRYAEKTPDPIDHVLLRLPNGSTQWWLRSDSTHAQQLHTYFAPTQSEQ